MYILLSLFNRVLGSSAPTSNLLIARNRTQTMEQEQEQEFVAVLLGFFFHFTFPDIFSILSKS